MTNSSDKNLYTIKEMHRRAVIGIKTGWPEMCFIVVLNAGIIGFVYACVIFISMLSGTNDTYLAVPSLTCPIQYWVAAVLLCVVVYVGAIPLHFGVRWFYWQLSRGTVMPLSSLFACYSSGKMMKKCFKVKLLTDMIFLCRAVICGGAIKFITVVFRVTMGTEVTVSASIGIFLIFIVLICTYLSMLDMVFIPFLFAENPDMSAGELVNISRAFIRRHPTFSIKLYFYCLPWYLTALLVFPLMIVIPLTNVIMAEYLRLIYMEEDPHEKKDLSYC